MTTTTSIIEINRTLDRYSHNIARMGWACDRIAWLAQYRKIPKAITDALATKAAAVMDGSWYGDEPEQHTIENYIKGVI